MEDTDRDQLLDKWLSDLNGLHAKRISDLDADYAKRRQRIDFKHQKDRERIRRIWSEDTDEEDIEDTEKPSSVTTQEVPIGSEESTASSNGADTSALNGSASRTVGNLSRRDLTRQIIPEFDGETFTAAEVREKFLDKYLETEPPNFPQAINNVLKRMVENGEIEQAGRQGEGYTAPWLYREKRNQEGSLDLE